MLPEEFIGNCERSSDCKAHRWYEHTPADVAENDEVELYWDLTIQTDMTVTHNSPDIILVEKAIRNWTIIDNAVPGDFNVDRTVAFEIKRIHHVETVILPVVIGALGTVPKRLIRSIELLGIGDIIASTQTTALLRRAMNL